MKNKTSGARGPKGEMTGIIFKTIFLIIILVTAGIGFWVHNWVTDVIAEAPRLNTGLIFRHGSTIIFDADGDAFSEGQGQRREWVQFDEIAPVMIDAILAIEDSRFFDHPGVDWSRTLVAVMYTAENMLTGSQSTQGGSTLTQQLINQTHLLLEDDERDNSISRKVQEIYLANQIEREFSKEQIIEAYLNYAPFGGRIHGIQAASEFYFGVDAIDLTLSQAATLAGLVQLPNVYRPDTQTQNAQARRNTVLDLMVRHGFINQHLADLAAAEPITDLLVYQEVSASDSEIYESFTNLVFEEMEERFGILNPHAGYQVFTTMNREAQVFIHNALHTDTHINWPNDNIQQAIVMMSNDGAIQAIGGRDLLNRQNIQRGHNLAAHMQRDVGSTSKPIWAYGPAFELLNWGTGSMIDDRVFGYDLTLPGSPLVHNWDRQYRGRVSVRNAMDWSWNVPAILAYLAVVEEAGQDQMDEFVNSLGIPTPETGFTSQYAIGGNEFGFSTLQMAGAYSAFANGGTFNEPFTITRIIAPNGDIIYGDEFHHSERVMEESTAYMMSSILRTVLTQGTGQWHATVPGQWVAGKTGTTNFPAHVLASHPQTRNGVPDSWFVGYSMDYTVAVWTGYQSITDGTFLNQDQQRFSQRMFRYIMREFNTAGTAQPSRPSNVVSATVEWGSGEENGEACSPSEFTPNGSLTGFSRSSMSWRMSELFVSGHTPSCRSERFESPETPENFAAEAGGGLTIDFSWDHIENLPMTLEEAQTARLRANGLARSLSQVTAALVGLEVSEAEAVMMIDKITAIGETEYVVYGVLANGSRRELGYTTEDNISITLSMADAAAIERFYVVTRFSNSGRSSDPSNTVNNVDLIDLSDIEITVPNMSGWTMTQLTQWADVNNVEYRIVEEVYSATIPANHVVSTNPTNRMSMTQTLQVTMSRGPEQYIPEVPGMPNPGDVIDGDDEDSYHNLNPFEMPGIDEIIHLNNNSRRGITSLVNSFLTQLGWND